MKTFVILFFAILSEVIATSSLKFSEGFTKPISSVIVAAGYGLSFYLLSIALKTMPIGVAYAIWSGVGLVLIVNCGHSPLARNARLGARDGHHSHFGGNHYHQCVLQNSR